MSGRGIVPRWGKEGKAQRGLGGHLRYHSSSSFEGKKWPPTARILPTPRAVVQAMLSLNRARKMAWSLAEPAWRLSPKSSRLLLRRCSQSHSMVLMTPWDHSPVCETMHPSLFTHFQGGEEKAESHPSLFPHFQGGKEKAESHPSLFTHFQGWGGKSRKNNPGC